MTDAVVSFSVESFAAWAPGVETTNAWIAWATGKHRIEGAGEPQLRGMGALLRRRAGFINKMALESAYQCVKDRSDVPAIFCSRHGESTRSVDLLRDLVCSVPLSPTSFSLSVHNATAGLFSVARGEHTNNIALAAGQSSVEHGVIEACGLLAEGEPRVLLVVYDCPLPALYTGFEDCHERPFAWSWLLRLPSKDVLSLCWSAFPGKESPEKKPLPGGLEIFRFYLRNDMSLERICEQRRWLWYRNA